MTYMISSGVTGSGVSMSCDHRYVSVPSTRARDVLSARLSGVFSVKGIEFRS